MGLFLATIKEGKLIYNNQKFVDDFLKHINNFPQVLVKIEKKRNVRSNQHNAYYWGYVLNEIAGITGHSPEELHSIFKIKFLPKKFVKIAGKEYQADPTTTRCDSAEFFDFIEAIKRFGEIELDIQWLDEEDYLTLNK